MKQPLIDTLNKFFEDNPVAIDKEGKILVDNHDLETVEKLADSFEKYVEKYVEKSLTND